jgi:hypothetical protein
MPSLQKPIKIIGSSFLRQDITIKASGIFAACFLIYTGQHTFFFLLRFPLLDQTKWTHLFSIILILAHSPSLLLFAAAIETVIEF